MSPPFSLGSSSGGGGGGGTLILDRCQQCPYDGIQTGKDDMGTRRNVGRRGFTVGGHDGLLSSPASHYELVLRR
eukprot:CAMPEP_0178533124 /NCGR_PEP_ID=MMETSP0696-20121128/34330_1 /TAXON_ID=265572 /ORGANISM="Extubocellulus spinifer, Strain CCMP396" /LENGTH=73 /DNA_ID=CAMNT_0020165147 /DNA_START=54 /DNA_END=275 /DNA_ORIENTATION=+